MTTAAKANLPADGVLKALGHLVQKDVGASGPPRFRMTSGVLDRHTDRVLPTALKTDNYLKNPVVLWNHNDGVPAIGTASILQEGEAWFMEPTFDGIGELSKEVAAKVEAGTLRTCSIRFQILEDGYDFNDEGGLDFTSVELLEISITNIPANQEALRVKTQTTPKPKNETAPPPAQEEQTPVKDEASGGATLDSVLAALQDLSSKVDQLLAAQSEASDAEPAEGEQANAEEGGEDEGMTAAEKQELKAWAASLK